MLIMHFSLFGNYFYILIILTNAQSQSTFNANGDPNIVLLNIGNSHHNLIQNSSEIILNYNETSKPIAKDAEKSITSNIVTKEPVYNYINLTSEIDLPYSEKSNDTFNIKVSRFLKDNPEAIKITSPGYPNPYPAAYNQTWSITVVGGTGIDVTIHDLDIHPFTGFLYFRGGTEESTIEKGPTLTGHRTIPINFKIIHTTELFIWFHSNYDEDEQQNHKGFVLTYAPFGKMREVTTEPNIPITVPETELQTFRIVLIVSKYKQNIDTWQIFRELLSNATNKFISTHDLSVDEARPENVTFFTIQKCSPNWPNYETCISVLFALPLWMPSILTTYNNTKYEMTSEHLWQMWNEFGKFEFAKQGFSEYSVPDSSHLLILWSGISVLVVLIFLIVLYGIWKIDVFQDYKRMHNSPDDQRNILKNQSEIDISMFPSPHQIVPTLFPSSDIYASSTGQVYAQDNRPITFTQTELQIENNIINTTPNFNRIKSGAHFSPDIIDFNEPKTQPNAFFPDDEDTFVKLPTSTPSPRPRAKVIIQGSSKNESVS